MVSDSERLITLVMVHTAINVVIFERGPATLQSPEPLCLWPKICGPQGCRYPHYSHAGQPAGLIAQVLIQLGYPNQLLLDLDREHGVGDLLHPGVKLAQSRNAALLRIEPVAMALLDYLQQSRNGGKTWGRLSAAAFGRTWAPTILDRRRRPWLY